MKAYICGVLLACCCSVAQAQVHPIDKYLNRAPVISTVADTKNKVLNPQDLDFCRVPGRERELWVVNKGDANGGTVVIIYHAGTSEQVTEHRHDSHAAHFMRNVSGIAMAASGNFGTSADILNTVGNTTTTFMGPTLWTSDTSIFARANQNDWVDGELLGSHSDMNHESPYTMGIASDTGNVYWVFDGYHKFVYRYDFAEPHPYGHDEHSDAIVREFDVPLKRIAGLPSHMVLDQATGWLYVVDNGNNRILRVQTKSGTVGEELFTQNEHLAEYVRIDDVTFEVIDSDLTRLCGIDFMDGRIIVSANNTGELRVYDVVGQPKYLGSIKTSEPGIRGVKVGPDSAIWYVNSTKNKVGRLMPGELLANVALQISDIGSKLYPSVAKNFVTVDLQEPAVKISIVNALGVTMKSITDRSLVLSVDVQDLPVGVYYCIVTSDKGTATHKFIISR